MKQLYTENLSVGYGKKKIVENINIAAYKGQILCLLGPNGAGKTTILRTIAGLLPSVDGAVYIDSKNLFEIPQKQLAKKLSVVLTSKFSGELLTGFEVAAMGRYPHTDYLGRLTENDRQKIKEALLLVNAQNLSNRYFMELSDGEKQKILVARALVQEPEIIILDEPTTHLDIRHRLELLEILKVLSKTKHITIILSLHEIDIAVKSCDTIVLVKGGQIVANGSADEIINNEVIKDLYGFESANFNNLLGSIEISNRIEPSVFVIGGGGSGIPIYRLLARHGIGTAAGIIHENDVDCEIAKTIGIDVFTEKPFEDISDLSLNNARIMIDRVGMVIDSGVEIGSLNRKNGDLLNYAVESGKKVVSFRKDDDCRKQYRENADMVKLCGNSDELITILNENRGKISGGVNHGAT